MSCVSRVTRLLKDVKGVTNVKVNFGDKKATVTGKDIDKKNLVKVLNDTNTFKAEIIN